MALFVEVAKAMSFRRAADAMGMPYSTLSRHIGSLEQAVGLRLLHRTTRKLELTEAGQIYFERCKHIVDEARLAHEQLGDMVAQPTGTLRASLPVDFFNVFLAPLIIEFAQLYPGIDFDFDLTSRRVDLISEPFDIAIRMGDSPDSNLISRQIARVPRFLYASPRYLHQAGEPVEPSDLAAHQCLRMRTAEAGHWTLHKGGTAMDVKVGGRFLLNNVGIVQRLATLDQGIAVLAEEAAGEDLAHGRLRRVLPAWQAPPIPVYALTETRLLPAKTQRFIDFLRERLKRA
jgi:DNA-binding transcriptional LysR family regulator